MAEKYNDFGFEDHKAINKQKPMTDRNQGKTDKSV